MGLFMTPFHMVPGVLSGFHPMLGATLPFATGYHGFPYPSSAVHRMPSANVVTEDDFQKMIQIHRKRRLSNEVLFTDSVFRVYACRHSLHCFQEVRKISANSSKN